MILNKFQADCIYGALNYATAVAATAQFSFNAHKKGRVVVRMTIGYGVVVEAFTGSNPIAYARETYDNAQHFVSSYEV